MSDLTLAANRLPARRLKLRRFSAGVYETVDGAHAILRTESDGPRGGRQYLWEISVYSSSGWVVGNFPPDFKLGDARSRLAAYIAAGKQRAA